MLDQEQAQTGINSVVLVGRAGKDPEIKYFESGSVKASFSLAVNRPTANKETDWFNVELFGRQAEFAGEYVKKGQLLGIIGRLSVRGYNDEAGNGREWMSVSGSEIRLLGSRRDNESGGGYGGGGQSAPF